MKATSRNKGGSEYSQFKHSDSNYKSPVFSPPPPPYSGEDHYKKCAAKIKEIADAFELYMVERTANDLVQTGIRWRLIQVQAYPASAHKDVEPLATVIFRAQQPVSQRLVDIAIDSVLAQLERNYVESKNPVS